MQFTGRGHTKRDDLPNREGMRKKPRRLAGSCFIRSSSGPVSLLPTTEDRRQISPARPLCDPGSPRHLPD